MYHLNRLPRIASYVLLILSLATAGRTFANTIVDTGPSQDGFANGFNFYSKLAVEFNVSSDMIITSIEGQLRAISGNVVISLYADGGDIPGTELHSGLLSGAPYEPQTATWRGIYGLNWAVAAGSYWVSFGSEDTFGSGALHGHAVSPQGNEAYSELSTWHGFDEADYTLRVMGHPPGDTVPDSGNTGLLIGTALVGAFLVRRRSAA